jgi:hypothetical protein
MHEKLFLLTKKRFAEMLRQARVDYGAKRGAELSQAAAATLLTEAGIKTSARTFQNYEAAATMPPEEDALRVLRLLGMVVDEERGYVETGEAGPATPADTAPGAGGIAPELLNIDTEYAGAVSQPAASVHPPRPETTPANAAGETLLIRVVLEISGRDIPVEVVARGRGDEVRVPASIRLEDPRRDPKESKR